MIETCIDCNCYDDVTQLDTFLAPFGDYFICAICAEHRGTPSNNDLSGA